MARAEAHDRSGLKILATTGGRRLGLLVLLALVVAGCGGASASGDEVSWEGLAASAGGTTSPASLDTLDEAVREATTTLLQTRSILAGQVTVYGDTVHFSAWVRFEDADTFEHVAFNPASAVPSPGDVVETHVTVVVAGETVRAASDSDGTWYSAAEPGAPFNIDLEGMAAGRDLDAPSGARATVRETADGTRVWTLQEESGFSRRWVVSTDGHLQGFALEHPTPLGSDSDSTLERAPLTRAEVRFVAGHNDPSITLPEVDTPLKIDRFDVWKDLPRPGDPA